MLISPRIEMVLKLVHGINETEKERILLLTQRTQNNLQSIKSIPKRMCTLRAYLVLSICAK